MQPALALFRSAVVAGMAALTALYPVVSPGQSSGTNLPRLIKIVVPFEPGASTDIFARLAGQELGARIGGTVVVENRTGATGSIGAEHVSRAVADGSTLMVTSTPFSANAAVRPKLPFDPVNGFAPVAMLASGPSILAVGNDTPYKSTAQLLDAARGNKGKIHFGSTGIGSSHHLNAALLNFEEEGVDPASMTAGEFTAFVRSDIDKWRDVARKLNIVAE